MHPDHFPVPLNRAHLSTSQLETLRNDRVLVLPRRPQVLPLFLLGRTVEVDTKRNILTGLRTTSRYDRTPSLCELDQTTVQTTVPSITTTVTDVTMLGLMAQANTDALNVQELTEAALHHLAASHALGRRTEFLLAIVQSGLDERLGITMIAPCEYLRERCVVRSIEAHSMGKAIETLETSATSEITGRGILYASEPTVEVLHYCQILQAMVEVGPMLVQFHR